MTPTNDSDELLRIDQILGHLAGAASLCWEPKPTGVFDPEQAHMFVIEAESLIQQYCDRIRIDEAKINYNAVIKAIQDGRDNPDLLWQDIADPIAKRLAGLQQPNSLEGLSHGTTEDSGVSHEDEAVKDSTGAPAQPRQSQSHRDNERGKRNGSSR